MVSVPQMRKAAVDAAPRIALWASLLGCVAWWLHAYLNAAYPPNDTFLDGVLLIVTSCAKIAVLITLPTVVCVLAAACDHRLRRVLGYALAWCATLGGVVLVLYFAHDTLAERLSNGAMRFYPASESALSTTYHYIGRDAWLARWQSGQVVIAELGLGLLIIGGFAMLAYRWGRLSWLGVVFTAAVLAAVVAWPLVFGLLVLDYDVFLGGLYSDSLALDLLSPLAAIDPASGVTLSIVAVFALVTAAATRIAGRCAD